MKFEDAVEIILEHEGGYVNHAQDPGGETKFGISKRAYPNLNIKLLTKEDAIAIYKRDYWDQCKIDFLPHELRLVVFDAAVNQGASAAIGLLQNVLGVKVDGIMGRETATKLSGLNPEKVLNKYVKQRVARYFQHPNIETFGKGWMTRLVDVALRSKGVGLNVLDT